MSAGYWVKTSQTLSDGRKLEQGWLDSGSPDWSQIARQFTGLDWTKATISIEAARE